MSRFVTHSGVAAPILVDNVDTDQIIPSREMTRISKFGLGEGLFAGWRYHYNGKDRTGPRDDFLLNQPAYAGTSILLGGKNFGCGSSREHAVWALHDYGIRVIIAPSFGRIFYRNCARNGVLAIELDDEIVSAIAQQIEADPQARTLTVDLERQQVRTPDGDAHAFEVLPADREMLLEGLDYIEYSLQFLADIDAFDERDRQTRGWAWL